MRLFVSIAFFVLVLTVRSLFNLRTRPSCVVADEFFISQQGLKGEVR